MSGKSANSSICELSGANAGEEEEEEEGYDVRDYDKPSERRETNDVLTAY